MNYKSIYIFIGTTAELIKLAPVIREFNKRNIVFTIIASGQNTILFKEFETYTGKVHVRPVVTPKSSESSVYKFLIWTVRTFFSLLVGMRAEFTPLNKKNSLFIVHGDTVSSLMGSLVASIYGLKLVHIESGLRSFHFLEPFPEEICRYIISRLADIHFCPNKWSMKNLDSMKGEKIDTTQNTLSEIFWFSMKKRSRNIFVKKIIKKKRKYFILVIHRQEHVIFGQKHAEEMLQYILKVIPDYLQCIFLVHDLSDCFLHSLGPVMSDKIANHIIQAKRMPYADFMLLCKNSEFVITDGGSNQEEMYYLGKPCLLLRNYTERTEGIHRNVLLSKNDKDRIKSFIEHYKRYERPPMIPERRPSQIIVDYLTEG